MIRLKGPTFSYATTGGLADVLAFAKSKKGTYAKAHSSPKQPRTGAQVGVRAMMSYLGRTWRTLTPANQATWNELATVDQVAPYHAFVRENMKRWNTFRGPSKEYPAADAMTPTTGRNVWVLPAVASVQCGLPIDVIESDWGSVLLKGDAIGFPIDRAHVIQIVTRDVTQKWTWVLDTPVAPGTYYYNSFTFEPDGATGAPGPYRQAIVT